MNFKFLLSLIYLLIFNACDLPNEANADCNDVNLGSAYIDECGRCVGGDSSFLEGEDKDVCGTCFGVTTNENDCARCNDTDAMNYIDIDGTDFLLDNDLCIYDLCEEYFPDINTIYECSSSEITEVYNEGDQLRCSDVELPLDVCFPGNCDNVFTLSSLYGKVSWIEITSSW